MILLGDIRDHLPAIGPLGESVRPGSVQTCITSPPYFGLRDYGVGGQIGLETAPDCLGWATGNRCGACFVCTMVQVFRGVRRVLRDDGTLWVNLGDSYANDGKWGGSTSGKHVSALHGADGLGRAKKATGLPPKSLMGMPWRVVLALQADGWCLRQEIIWSKPNPMPESVRDRCTKSHEQLFLFSKSERYYWDFEAMQEPVSENTHARLSQNVAAQVGSTRAHAGGKTNGNMKAVVRSKRDSFKREDSKRGQVIPGQSVGTHRLDRDESDYSLTTRNRRSVWTIPTEACKEAHFATYPRALVEPCILASTKPSDLVLDPFLGSGTTAMVAQSLGRQWVGCELNPEYAAIAERRIRATQPGLPLEFERGAA